MPICVRRSCRLRRGYIRQGNIRLYDRVTAFFHASAYVLRRYLGLGWVNQHVFEMGDASPFMTPHANPRRDRVTQD